MKLNSKKCNSPAWSTLTQGQSDLIESIQKRALRILLPEMSYQDALNYTGLKKLSTRRHNCCEQLIRKLKLDNGPINPLKLRMLLQLVYIQLLIIIILGPHQAGHSKRTQNGFKIL